MNAQQLEQQLRTERDDARRWAAAWKESAVMWRERALGSRDAYKRNLQRAQDAERQRDELLEACKELCTLVDDAVDNRYRLDTFTTAPAARAIASVEKGTE